MPSDISGTEDAEGLQSGYPSLLLKLLRKRTIVSTLLLQFIRFQVVQNLCSSKQLEIAIVLEFCKLCLHVSHSKMNNKLIAFLVNYPKHI